MKLFKDDDLYSRNGGKNYMGINSSKLESQFEKACKRKNMDQIMSLLSELQSRGKYGWARETAAKYGITSF